MHDGGYVLKKLVGTIVLWSLVAASAALADNTVFDFYGYIKADAIYDFKRMDPDWNSTMRPSQILIPREEGPYFEDGEFILNIRATRLGVDVFHHRGEDSIRGKLEIDFYGTGSQPSQLVPRLRHAHIVYGDFIIGQAWSLYCDPEAFPVTLDFWGPNGLNASRRPQLRWTFSNSEAHMAAVALENHGAGLDEGKSPSIDPNYATTDRNLLPDLTSTYRLGGKWGYLRLAGVLRRVGYERTDVAGKEHSDHKTGWGGYLTGRFNVQDRNALQFAVQYGEAVANYINDGGSDLTGNDDGTGSEVLPLFSWHLSYQIWWADGWSTSLGYSEVEQDNTAYQEDDAFHRGRYGYANLIRHPRDRIHYGLEFLYGNLEERDGLQGEDYRIQLSMKFEF